MPKTPHEKAMQRALMQYRAPHNYELVQEALKKAGRNDLIGFDKTCLIRPRKISSDKPWEKGSKTDRISRISSNKTKNAQTKTKQGNKSDAKRRKQ